MATHSVGDGKGVPTGRLSPDAPRRSNINAFDATAAISDMTDDISLSEKRVYGDTDGSTTAFVASDIGLVRVSVSDDIVGEFSLERRGPTTAVAAADGRVAIGTSEDVLVAADGGFHETGFGPATAVGYHEGLVAAGGGRVARYDGTWTTLAELNGVRAIDGPMLAAESGVHRLDGTHVGLEDAHDVSSTGAPLAATASGLYYLANGWMQALDGAFTTVSGDGEVAHAATADALYACAEPSWRAVDLPVDGAVVDIAYGEGTYAVTESGEVLASVGDGWRHRSVGVTGVTGLAVL
jgi:hypothetical protein